MNPSDRVRHRATLAATLGATVLAGALAGCGRVGPLEQPAPLLGAENKRDYYADKAARQHAAAQHANPNAPAQGSADNAVGDDDAPLTTRDVKDPGQQLTSPRDAPVPGAPNPLGPNVNTLPQ